MEQRSRCGSLPRRFGRRACAEHMCSGACRGLCRWATWATDALCHAGSCCAGLLLVQRGSYLALTRPRQVERYSSPARVLN